MLAVGIFVWALAPGDMATRKGYSEPFYPANLGFMTSSVGVLILLLPTAGLWAPGLAGRMLERLGRCSLFLYVAHLVLLDRVWLPVVGSDLELVPFLNVFAALLLTLWGLAAWYQEIRQFLRERQLSVRDLAKLFTETGSLGAALGRLARRILPAPLPAPRSVAGEPSPAAAVPRMSKAENRRDVIETR